MSSNFINILVDIKNEKDAKDFLDGLFTSNEIKTLDKRWRILELLENGATQREIAKDLNVSLCKVTRGAKILKNQDSIISKYLKRENKNEKNRK